MMSSHTMNLDITFTQTEREWYLGHGLQNGADV